MPFTVIIKVASSIPASGNVYSIQHDVIKVFQ